MIHRPRIDSASPAGSDYVPSLDGLRAVSIGLVVAAHLGCDFVPGGFGVTLFFFISGLLITNQLLREFGERGRIAFLNFYVRRCLRLMPAGMTYIAIAGLVFVAIGGAITPAGWLAAFLYGGNYYELFVLYDSTVPGVRHPLNIIWSLAVEEHFYLIWPALLSAAARSRRGVLLGLLGFCVAILAWRGWLYDDCLTGHPGALCGERIADRLYKATDTRLDSIAWGAAAGVALAGGAGPRFLAAARSRAALLLAACALLSTFAIPDPFFRETVRYSLQGASLAFLLPALIARDTPLRRALETAPAVLVGRLSYSIYLWHW
ncbi:MAG: acyltransferase, partial [Alphaproteobacteria bacterium]|nr:acyltransferase [Alphaproteobacteria bacterium]